MNFIKKNFVTLLVVGATIALAGVAVFTALRLYQLRRSPVTPVQPASTPSAANAPVSVSPQSGNWNHPEHYLVTNVTQQPVEVTWQLDCWDDLLCKDETGTETLAAGQSFEKGFGSICSKWQLNLNYTGTATANNDVWDYAGVAEVGPECDAMVSDLTSSDSGKMENTNTTTPEASESASPAASAASDFETQACTTFAFTLGSTGGIGGSDLPSTTPSPTATPTVTPTVTVQPATPTATPATLPNAGVSTPTIIGIGAGSLLLLFALVLAI